jgi:hypothetical protein
VKSQLTASADSARPISSHGPAAVAVIARYSSSTAASTPKGHHQVRRHAGITAPEKQLAETAQRGERQSERQDEADGDERPAAEAASSEYVAQGWNATTTPIVGDEQRLRPAPAWQPSDAQSIPR